MADLASLVVRLSADVASLQSDLGKAVGVSKQAADQISGALSQGLESATDKLKEFAGQIVAAFAIEKVIEFGNQAIELGDQLNKMSQKVGISVENLSALRNQAQLSDVSLEDLGGSLTKLARSAAEAAGGAKQQSAAYAAIGVSVKDANGQLKPMQDILTAVAAKFSDYQDSASKTALAQQLFGKSGAALIPLLNELGDKGFGEVTKAANEYNQVISGEQAKNSEEFHDNLTKLSQATQGIALAITEQLLPSLVKLTGGWADAAKTQDGYASETSVVVNAIKGVVFVVLAAKESIVGLENVVLALGDTLGAAGDLFGGFAKGVGGDLTAIGAAMKGDFAGAKVALDAAGTSLADGWNTAKARVQAAASAMSDGVNGAVANTKKSYDALFGTFSNVSSGAETTAIHVRNLTAPLVANADAAKAAEKAQTQLDAAFAKDAQTLSKLAGEQDPVTKNYQKYVAAIEEAQAAYQAEIALAQKAGAGQAAYAQAKQIVIDKSALAVKALQAENAELLKANDVVGLYLTKIGQDQAEVGMTDRQKAMAEAVADLTDKWTKLNPAIQAYEVSMGALDPTTAAGAAAIRDATGALYDSKKAFDDNQKAVQEWVGIFKSAGDSIADAFSKFVVEGGSLMDSLKDTAKQVVEAIIAQFTKLAIINPILNSIFGMNAGGGNSLLATLGSGSGGGGLLGSLFGGGAGTTSSSGSNLYSLASGNSAGGGIIQNGQNILSSFNTGKGVLGWLLGGDAATTSGVGNVLGDYTGYGTQDLNYGGSFDFAADNGGSYGDAGFNASTAGVGASGYSGFGSGYGYGGGLGSAVGVAGGIYAGYNEFQNAGGGIAGAAGGLAYGVGTYAIGGAVTAGVAAGSLTAGLAAIPVAGWIAIAAMLIDKFSGGKLFGTAGKVESGQTYLNTTDTGASIDASVNLKGQKALFGGSKWSTKDVDPGQDAIDAANAFFTALKKGTDAFAQQFGLAAGTVVDATFKTVLDNNGKPTGETETTIGGQTFKNETQDQFNERVQASDMVADLATAGVQISKYTDAFIADADAWAKAVQDTAGAALAATSDIAKGFTFLGASGATTVQALLDFAQANVQSGEDVGQAYARLEAAQASYNSFVGGFTPAATYVDAFEQSLSGIQTSLVANIAQANALAKAAGAEGASVTDLTNIHKYAAAQFVALVAQLQTSAQQLAFSLGVSNVGSLDQVTAEIQALESKAGTGSSAISGFGNAMQSASQKATDAINLLIGDLSPLNDQQKLQTALAGLKAGTVSQDAVLQIGRRLYASSQQYADLFKIVQGYPGAGATSGTGGVGSTGGSGLSAAEQAQLAKLKSEQAGLQAAQTGAQFQTLAQQIAELASAKGETYTQAIADLKIDNAALMKGLGLSDQKAEDDYFASIQKQVDSNGDNTQTLVDKLDDVKTGIVDAIRGITPTAANGTLLNDGSHSAHGNPDVFGSAGTTINPFVPRGQRIPAAAGATP